MSSSQQSEYDHSSAEWEAQRELFTHFYVVEDKPLWEVKEIMEQSYGFRATERQYKRRIAQWNLDKNIKDSDMKVMLRMQLKRRNEGKESEFYIHGRPVQAQKLDRYVRRKGMSESEIRAYNAPVPSYISVRTPTSTPAQTGESSYSSSYYPPSSSGGSGAMVGARDTG